MLRVLSLMFLANILFAGVCAADGRKLALLVGCENYVHAHLTDLEYAEEDVLELAEVLKGQGFVCTVLTHQTGAKDPDLEPTASNIRKALTKLLAGVSKNDLFLVGLAGHGMQPLGYDEPFFCPKDANPVTKDKSPDTTVAQVFVKPETMVGIGTMLAEIDASGVGQKLVIVDACRNSPMLRGRNAAFTFKTLPQQTGLILSCSSGQFANESKMHKHGIFFYAVLEGLRGEAADKKGLVTIDDLAAYAKRRTREIATKMEAKQQPQTVLNLDGEPIVLARVEAKPTAPSTQTKPAGAASRSAGERLLVKTSGIDLPLRWCPPGTFMMGSPKNEPDRSGDEDQVRVTLTNGFWIAETEVTQDLYENVIGANPSDNKGARLPVEQVSWDDAVEFCEKLTSRERAAGRLSGTAEYRLPTEAEWEYACRAGTRTATAFGSSLSSEQANFDGNYPYNGAANGPNLKSTCEVGKYVANAWGLKDMHGNVYEWCADKYKAPKLRLDDGKAPNVEPRTVDGHPKLRGGCWNTLGHYCRSSSKYVTRPGDRDNFVGFRCLRTE
jgi:sulfatase modifying factor 1